MILSTLFFSLLFSSAAPVSPAAFSDMPHTVLSGVVTELDGKAIARAEVRLTNVGTGESVTVRTNESGAYQLNVLDRYAEYVVSVRSIGFIPESRPPMRIGMLEVADVSFTLTPINVPMLTAKKVGVPIGSAVFLEPTVR